MERDLTNRTNQKAVCNCTGQKINKNQILESGLTDWTKQNKHLAQFLQWELHL
jgi:hypothetical protein